jgi:hypothetical protein
MQLIEIISGYNPGKRINIEPPTALQINIAHAGGQQVNFQDDVNAQKATPPTE